MLKSILSFVSNGLTAVGGQRTMDNGIKIGETYTMLSGQRVRALSTTRKLGSLDMFDAERLDGVFAGDRTGVELWQLMPLATVSQ